jgi:hypothetical protein
MSPDKDCGPDPILPPRIMALPAPLPPFVRGTPVGRAGRYRPSACGGWGGFRWHSPFIASPGAGWSLPPSRLRWAGTLTPFRQGYPPWAWRGHPFHSAPNFNRPSDATRAAMLRELGHRQATGSQTTAPGGPRGRRGSRTNTKIHRHRAGTWPAGCAHYPRTLAARTADVSSPHWPSDHPLAANSATARPSSRFRDVAERIQPTRRRHHATMLRELGPAGLSSRGGEQEGLLHCASHHENLVKHATVMLTIP